MTKKAQKNQIDNKVILYDPSGKKDGTFELDKTVFSGIYSPSVIYQAVIMYQANKRTGLASTKVRNEVSGGGKKPWKQKGTGRARAGSTRSPLWRHGGTIFGPHPKSFKYQIPKKIKRSALIHSLNSKLHDGLFSVIKEFKMGEPKTKKFKSIMDKTKLEGTILVATDRRDKNLELASRNLKSVTLTEYRNLNALAVLKHNNFLITEGAIGALTGLLKKKASR